MAEEFFKQHSSGKVTLYFTVDAFNAMCGMNAGETQTFVNVKPAVYWAYGEVQLVWRDIMEKYASATYEPKTVTKLTLERTINKHFVCYFTFKDVEFFADRVENTYTICLKDEH